jgi:hypothetical protein
MQALIKEKKASQPQQEIMHLIISGSHFIWVKNGFLCDDWSSPSL